MSRIGSFSDLKNRLVFKVNPQYIIFVIKKLIINALGRLVVEIYLRIVNFTKQVKRVSLIIMVTTFVVYFFIYSMNLLMFIIVLIGLLIFYYFKFIYPLILMRKAEVISRFQPPMLEMFTQWETYPIESSFRQRIGDPAKGQDIVLGVFDQGGHVLEQKGRISHTWEISRESFFPRVRTDIEIVLKDGLILIRKNFRGRRLAFAREWLNLKMLENHANIPRVYDAQKPKTLLYMNFIPGRTFREILESNGVVFEKRKEYKGDRHLIVAGEIKKYISQKSLNSLVDQMNIIHRMGIFRLDIKLGNFILGIDDCVYWIDFEYPFYLPKWIPIHFLFRDRDREVFNRRLDAQLITERTARRILKKMKIRNFPPYAPVNFGMGLSVGRLWHVEGGTGKWEYFIKKHLHDLAGKRILDLGSNVGILPLMMLRQSAFQVVGVELNREYYNQAKMIHQLFEWRDNRKYNFELINDNMTCIIKRNMGKFDIITSFCSLYYLSESDMEAVIHEASQKAPIFVVQANIHVSKKRGSDRRKKASIEFLSTLMQRYFSEIKIIAPRGYSRPLLIASKSKEL